VALAAAAAGGCTLRRDYLGSPVRLDGTQAIVAGLTTKGEVLSQLGPPDGIVRQFDGDIFVYRYVRRNTATFRIEEPVFTNLEIFSWTRSEQRHDSIVVLFDEEGIVQQVGAAEGTEEMRPF
jgi:hypothetical protein